MGEKEGKRVGIIDQRMRSKEEGGGERDPVLVPYS